MEIILTGSYTDMAGSGGIHGYKWLDGVIEPMFVQDCINPSFMAYTGGCLYAASELESGGQIVAYATDLDRTALSFLNKLDVPCTGLCHIAVTPDNMILCAAAYGSGHVLICDILPDGRIGGLCDIVKHEGRSIHSRQTSAHTHQALPYPPGFITACDLGLDKVFVYALTRDSRLLLKYCIDIPAGEGPRHAVTHPHMPRTYVLTELGNKILLYTMENGCYHCSQAVPISDNNADDACAELIFSKDFRFIYASVRGSDRIVCLDVSEKDGSLSNLRSYKTPGAGPRMFSLSANGKFMFVALQKSSRISVLSVDLETGALTDTGCGIEVPNVCFVQSIIV